MHQNQIGNCQERVLPNLPNLEISDSLKISSRFFVEGLARLLLVHLTGFPLVALINHSIILDISVSGFV